MKEQDVNQEVQIQKLVTTLEFVQKDLDTVKTEQKGNYDGIMRKLEEISISHTALRTDINNGNRLILEHKILFDKHVFDTATSISKIESTLDKHEEKWKREEWLKNLGKGVLGFFGLSGTGAILYAVWQVLQGSNPIKPN